MLVVFTGWIRIFGFIQINSSILRGVKILQPLKMLNKTGQMRALSKTISKCLRELVPVAISLLLFFIVVGIAGISDRLSCTSVHDVP